MNPLCFIYRFIGNNILILIIQSIFIWWILLVLVYRIKSQWFHYQTSTICAESLCLLLTDSAKKGFLYNVGNLPSCWRSTPQQRLNKMMVLRHFIIEMKPKNLFYQWRLRGQVESKEFQRKVIFIHNYFFFKLKYDVRLNYVVRLKYVVILKYD